MLENIKEKCKYDISKLDWRMFIGMYIYFPGNGTRYIKIKDYIK